MKTSRRHRDEDDDHSRSNHSRRKDRSRSQERHRNKSPSRKDKKHRRTSPDERRHRDHRIKTEEEFDARHDELRRKRQETNRAFKREIKQENENRNKRVKTENKKSEHERYGKPEHNEEDEEEIVKEQPNLGLSGALTEDTNTYRGVVIKYNEPPEARVPKKKWRLYPFKGDEQLKVLHLHRQSGYLIGKLRRVVDIPVDHPSCSKQHAVFQFRLVSEKVNGKTLKKVKPYIIDLESTNGTYVNNDRIEARRYVELKEQDMLKFGFSSREYVLLHDKCDTSNYIDAESSEDDD